MNITSRRGTKSHNPQHALLSCVIQAFIILTPGIIVIGYYYFLSTTSFSTVADGGSGRSISSENLGSESNAASSIRTSQLTNRKNDKVPLPKATIAYAITVSGCPKNNDSRGDFGAGITDGAAVLQNSIRLNSIRNYPQSSSRYDYKMYALVHPEAESCARPTLQPLGYEILIRDVPVPLTEIEGQYLRENVPKNGCCGEKEFVKLHAYTLVEHPVVVHLDLDTLVLKPMDRLFDVMIDGPPRDGGNGGIDVAFGDPLVSAGGSGGTGDKNQINAFFTRDYNMAHMGMKHAGVQGGFLVLRPSLEVYKEFESIVRKGDFQSGKGWGGLGFGPFYGSMTFQGIIPYFYDHLHPGTGVELDHCVYNNMADNPRDQPTKNDIVSGRCRDGYNRPDRNDQCEDCRSRPLEDVVTTHFTLCQKPWECHPQDDNRIQERLCRKFHGEWFRIREDLETSVWGRKLVNLKNEKEATAERGGGFQVEQFRGYCKSRGKSGYIQMKVP